jgi:hypothetical protein
MTTQIATCVINKEKNDVELHFKSKPSTAILDDLKANGFRWGKFNKCWYRADNYASRRVVAKYADIPTESTQDGLLVEAQENAGVDNWAQENGI